MNFCSCSHCGSLPADLRNRNGAAGAQTQPRPALEDLPGTGFSETQLGARRLAWKPPEVPSGAEFPWDKSGLLKQLNACSCSVPLLLLAGLGCQPGPCSVGTWVMLQQPRCPASWRCNCGCTSVLGDGRWCFSPLYFLGSLWRGWRGRIWKY